MIIYVIDNVNFENNFIITQLAMFDLLYISTTISGLLQELNVRWLLLARWRGEQTVPHVTTEHSVPEEGRRWWSKRRSKLNIASCVIMNFVSNNILPT